jgi:hypothetical protein
MEYILLLYGNESEWANVSAEVKGQAFAELGQVHGELALREKVVDHGQGRRRSVDHRRSASKPSVATSRILRMHRRPARPKTPHASRGHLRPHHA